MLMNGKEINSLEDLRQNLNLKELFQSFQSGELSRWLKDNGYICQSRQISELSLNESMLLSKICTILGFNPDSTEDNVKYL